MAEQRHKSYGGKDRRSNPHLRALFDQACQATASLFDSHDMLGGYENLVVFAQRIIHDAFPQLSMQEVSLLVSGVVRFHQMRLGQRTQ